MQINAQFYRVLSWNVSQLRQKQGLTQEVLAEKTGLSRQQISRIERGLGELSFDALVKVADFFQVKVAVLCEERPKGLEMNAEIRSCIRENGELKYAKEFSESPKIRWLQVSARQFRKLQIQKNIIYDFIVTSGEVIVQGDEVYETLKAPQILSVKGEGRLRVRSSSQVPNSELWIVQI